MLFLLDEFAALGRLEPVERAMGLMAGYGMQLWSILQDLHQLRATYGDKLIADTQELYDYVHGDEFVQALDAQGVAGISNGAIALLDEVATGKISGEEDWWSGTDLWDFAANVEGSKMAFSLARDFAATKGDEGAALVEDIDADALKEKDPTKLIPPLHGALLKNEQDVHLFERLAFLARREGAGSRPGQ